MNPVIIIPDAGETTSENETIDNIKSVIKIPIVKIIVYSAGILLIIYCSGFAFRIIGNAIIEYKFMNAAIRS